MELEKLVTNLLDRLDRIDEEDKGSIIENKISITSDSSTIVQMLTTIIWSNLRIKQL